MFGDDAHETFLVARENAKHELGVQLMNKNHVRSSSPPILAFNFLVAKDEEVAAVAGFSPDFVANLWKIYAHINIQPSSIAYTLKISIHADF